MPPKRSKASSFPAARIKRIMQQDDDVGKVAGASPLVVSKAVELFLQDMLQHIEKEARQKNTKKVSMHHVKRAVQNTPSLDFLKDLVATIPDPAADDEDAEFGGAGGEKKTRKRAPKAASGESKNGKAKAVKTEGGASAGGSKGKAKQQQNNHSQASASNAAPPAATAAEAQAGPKVSIPISSLLSNRDDDDADYQDEEEDAEVNEPTAMETDAVTTSNQAVKAEEPAQAVRANEEDEDYD